MKQFMCATLLALSLGSLGHVAQAQTSVIAFASLTNGNVLEGFVGPWRGTPTGIEIQYAILCYHTGTRQKVTYEVRAVIPDGSTLNDIRVNSTTAVVNGCAEFGLTVPRGAVILPAIQLGQ